MKKIIPGMLLAVPLLMTSGCHHEQKAAWAQFRGHNASGIAMPHAKPPVIFGEDKNLQWKIDLPVGGSSPVIWDDRIYLTASLEEKKELQTLCIDRASGTILWSYSIFPEKLEKVHPVSNHAPATIAADVDGIYVYFGSRGIMCFDHEGILKWEKTFPVPDWGGYGNPASPVIMDDKVILNLDYGNEDLRCLLALDKKSGEVVWRTLTQEVTPFVNYGYSGYSTPVRMHDQVILHRCGGIAGYSLADGSPVWWLQILTNGIGTPIIYNEMIFVNAWMEMSEKERRGAYFEYDSFEKVLGDFDLNGDGLLEQDEIPEDLMVFTRPGIDDIDNTSYAARRLFRGMDEDKDGFVNEPEWMNTYNFWNGVVDDFGMMAIPADHSGEMSVDDIIWMHVEKTPEVPGPLAYGDCIYTTTDGGWMTCMDAITGKVHFQERIGAPGAYIASPILADGNVYLASYNGTVMVIEAGTKPQVISETKLQGKILATPAITGGNLYVRTSEHLYAFKD